MARILIADDDEMTVEVARAALSTHGHIVGSLPDGKNVRDVVETKRPDLLVLDCAMPEVGGIDVLRQIRTSANAYKLPILMLTGRRGAVDEEIAYRAGADDYLTKPFCPDRLVAIVEVLLDSSKRARR